MEVRFDDSFFDLYMIQKQNELIAVQQYFNQLAIEADDKEEQNRMIEFMLYCFDADRLLSQFSEFKKLMDQKIQSARYEYTKLKMENYELKDHVRELEKKLENALEGI